MDRANQLTSRKKDKPVDICMRQGEDKPSGKSKRTKHAIIVEGRQTSRRKRERETRQSRTWAGPVERTYQGNLLYGS
jgi:hypothetical protein